MSVELDYKELHTILVDGSVGGVPCINLLEQNRIAAILHQANTKQRAQIVTYIDSVINKSADYPDKKCTLAMFHNDPDAAASSIPDRTYMDTDYWAGLDTMNSTYGGESLCWIPPNVKEIGAGAFKNSTIKKVLITGPVKVLNTETFADCPELEEIEFVLPNSLQVIQSGAISNCPNLKKIKFPASIAEFKSKSISGVSDKVVLEFPAGCLKKLQEDKLIFPEDMEDLIMPNKAGGHGKYAKGDYTGPALDEYDTNLGTPKAGPQRWSNDEQGLSDKLGSMLNELN